MSRELLQPQVVAALQQIGRLLHHTTTHKAGQHVGKLSSLAQLHYNSTLAGSSAGQSLSSATNGPLSHNTLWMDSGLQHNSHQSQDTPRLPPVLCCPSSTSSSVQSKSQSGSTSSMTSKLFPGCTASVRLLAEKAAFANAKYQRHIHQSTRAFSSINSGENGVTGGEKPGSKDSTQRITLQEALNRLVDEAVRQVEASNLEAATSLLQEGINTFEPAFPNTPEVGELHNQDQLQAAAKHAQSGLEITQFNFGKDSLLTAHRMLRLGVCKFALADVPEAASLLKHAYDILEADSSRYEAAFYLDLIALSSASEPPHVRGLEDNIVTNIRKMRDHFGSDSMMMSLALGMHSRLTNQALERDFPVGEALLKQHCRLVEEVHPNSEELAFAYYKLATLYYTHDFLPDARGNIHKAATLMRTHHPDENDEMIIMMKHRMGMICAASGDFRAANQFLTQSREFYASRGKAGAMLAEEAAVGLAMARFRALKGDLRKPAAERAAAQQEALDEMKRHIDQLTTSIGGEHMLVEGATRYYAQLAKLLAQQ